MGRINNTDKYPLDDLVTVDDSFIGSDIDNNGRTKNYSIRGLLNLVSDQSATNTSDLVNDGANGTDPFITASDVPAGATNTSDLVNDGENGTDPFITASDVPAGATNTSDLLNNGENGIDPFITASDVPAGASNTSDLTNDGANGTDPFITANDVPAGATNTSDLTNDGANGTDPFITASDVPAGTSLAVQDGVVIDVTGLTVDAKQVKQVQKLITPADLVNNKYRVLNMFPQGANQFGVNPVVVDHFKVNISPTEVSRIGFRVFMDGPDIKLEVNNPNGLSQVLFNYALASGASGSFAANRGVTITLGAGTTGEDVIISNFRYRDIITNQVINPAIANVTLVVDNVPANAVDTNFTSVYDLPIGHSLTGSDVDAYINVYGEVVHQTELIRSYIITIQFTEL
jgi:hypothetical protein